MMKDAQQEDADYLVQTPRLGWDAATWVGMALNAVIPVATLIWTVSSGYWFWSATLGSAVFGIISVVMIETMGLIGLGLYIAGWDERNVWVRLRWVLPYMPIPSLAYAIHALVEANAGWIAALASVSPLPAPVMAWAFTAVCVAALTLLSRSGWKALEVELDDMFGAQVRRTQRWESQRMRALRAAHLAAAARARVSIEELMLEVQTLRITTPDLQAKAVAAQQHAASAMVRLEALQQALRDIRRAAEDGPADGDDGGVEQGPTIVQVKAALLLAAGRSQNFTAQICGIGKRRLREWINGGDPRQWALELIDRVSDPFVVQQAIQTLPDEVRTELTLALSDDMRKALTHDSASVNCDAASQQSVAASNGTHPA